MILLSLAMCNVHAVMLEADQPGRMKQMMLLSRPPGSCRASVAEAKLMLILQANCRRRTCRQEQLRDHNKSSVCQMAAQWSP